jgi:hypothetical protein
MALDHFFAWVMGGSLPAALAAAVVEEVVGERLKELLGLPAAASFALVTGCQMAHATCLAAAGIRCCRMLNGRDCMAHRRFGSYLTCRLTSQAARRGHHAVTRSLESL